MLYTRKGDKGTTKTYGCDQRMSKSSAVAEALGTLDEINSYLGIPKVLAEKSQLAIDSKPLATHIHEIQETLFMIQAEVAGFPMKIDKEKVESLEAVTDRIEHLIPPIKTFFISGGTELAASCDFARTLARRAERRVVSVHEEGSVVLGEYTLPYLNRLSSALYAFARFVHHASGNPDQAPKYR